MDIIKQKNSAWCGVAVTQMILSAFHLEYPQQPELAKLLHTDRDGTSFENIAAVLKGYGIYPEQSYYLTYESLYQLRKRDDGPILLHWWDDRKKPADGHYSMLVSMTPKELTLADPWTGRKIKLSRQFWDLHWKDTANPERDGAYWGWCAKFIKFE